MAPVPAAWAACDPGESYIDVAYHGFAVAASAEPDDYKYVGAIHDKLICYGIAQMKGEGDLEKSQASEKNQAYDSVRQAASGAAAAVADFRPNRELVSLSYAVPVVVTTHPLLVAHLDEDNDISVQVTGSGCLNVRPAGHDDALLVHVVHEDALSGFIEVCRETANSFERVPLHANPIERARRLAARVGRRILRRSR